MLKKKNKKKETKRREEFQIWNKARALVVTSDVDNAIGSWNDDREQDFHFQGVKRRALLLVTARSLTPALQILEVD